MILLVVAAVALASCSSQTSQGNTKAFIGGTVGISSQFLAGEPPTEVTSSNYPFSTTVELKNEGEWTVPNADVWVTLKGFDGKDFNKASQDSLTDHHPDGGQDLERNQLNPDTGEVIEGAPAYVTFDNLQYSVPITGNHQFPFVVDTCYEYTTFANAELCIKKDLLDTTKDTSVCMVSGPRVLQNSGAPVQISQFIEYTAGKTAVRFSMTVSKVGQGDVSKSTLTSSGTAPSTHCSTLTSEKDIVHVKVNTGLDGTLSCAALGGGAEGDVRLINGIAQVQCTQQVTDLSDKIKLVDIEVSYGFLSSIQTQVLVKEVTS